MSKITTSEELFQHFCDSQGMTYIRVPTASKKEERTPDYRLSLGDLSLIAEVKEFQPNKEEQRALAEGLTKGFINFPVTEPGAKIRSAISDALPQLRRLSHGEKPTILVIYNNGSPDIHTDPYSVMTAMQGLDVVVLKVPRDATLQPRTHGTRSGPKKKTTSKHNTTLSAIAVLNFVSSERMRLDVYHSMYAKIPIEPKKFLASRIWHFCITSSAVNSLQGWEQVF